MQSNYNRITAYRNGKKFIAISIQNMWKLNQELAACLNPFVGAIFTVESLNKSTEAFKCGKKPFLPPISNGVCARICLRQRGRWSNIDRKQMLHELN